jgi:tetratricopeptide (TPR) repeat protein
MTDAPVLDGIDDTMAAAEASPARPRQDPESAELAVGTVVQRYVVLGRVGAGGMGVVYSAYDPELDRKVALKLLHAHPRGDRSTDGPQRLLREAQALAKLSHPNVVAIHDVGDHEGCVWIAMEFVEGCTFAEWLAKEPRSWRAVLDAYVQAGRGLAAAHDKGLVHRDFKPDNVMVSDDGRIRVMDFGLARPGDQGGSGIAAVADLDPTLRTPSARVLTSALTRDGSLLGTPAYMAPEQWLGEPTDARTDQFSFCVALWEGLFGERPFAGDNPGALAASVIEGRRLDPPRRGVPGWLRRACARGLASEPQRRFATLPELLSTLARGQARARRRGLLVAAGVVTGLGLGALGVQRYRLARADADCIAEGADIDGSWNDEHRELVRAGLLGSGISDAQASVDKVLPWLDRQAAAWRDATTESCRDAHVRGTMNEATLDRSRWCLAEPRMQLDATVAELAHADRVVAFQAVLSSSDAPSVEVCRDERALALMPALPDDRAEVEAVRRDLSRVYALHIGGHFDEGLVVAKETLARAEAVGWSPLVAAAQLAVGEELDGVGRYDEAKPVLENAYFTAMGSDALATAEAAADDLVQSFGHRLRRVDEARTWARHAGILLDALGDDANTVRRIALDVHVARSLRGGGDLTEARALLERALPVAEETLGSEHPRVAEVLNELGNVREDQGDPEGAKPLFARALAIHEAVLGPSHPNVAGTLANLGGCYWATGDYATAKEMFERALTVLERAHGPDHPEVAHAIGSVAATHLALGEHQAAIALFRREVEILEGALGPDHPQVALALNNLAAALHGAHDYRAAAAMYERALAIREKQLGPDHTEVAYSLSNLALVQELDGDFAHARAGHERALAIWERNLGRDHPATAFATQGLASIALEQQRPADALPFAERAVHARSGGDAPPELVAESQWYLAQALWDAPEGQGRDRERARRVAIEARDTFRAAAGKQGAVAELDAWLASR